MVEAHTKWQNARARVRSTPSQASSSTQAGIWTTNCSWEKAKKAEENAHLAFEKQVQVGHSLAGKGSGKVSIRLPV